MRWIRVFIFFMLATFGKMEEEVRLDSNDTKKSSFVIANDESDRREPINIDSKILPTSNRDLILFVSKGGSEEKAVLKNTGYSVEAQLDEQKTNASIILGKAFIFVFTRIIFYYAETKDGVAGTTIQGENGTALEISVLYYNIKYGTYIEALNHRDGILELRIRVNTTSSKNNMEFNTFANKMKKIVDPNSTAEITFKDLNSWLSPIPSSFYAYAGSLKNASNGETKPCSITIVVDNVPEISQSQFEETFPKIMSSKGGKLITKQKQYPRGNRAIIHTTEKLLVKNILPELRLTSRYM